jgi:predicted DNA-binding protein (UPF0251 family)
VSYTRELVEQLLPAVWDDLFALNGLDNPYRPDPDMPHVAANPKTGNTIYAMLADIRTAWRKTPLSTNESAALRLRFRDDLKQADVAALMKMRRQSAAEHIDSGVGRITDYLNGDDGCTVKGGDAS